MISSRGGTCPLSNTAWRLSLGGTPNQRNRGSWQVLYGVSKSYRPLIIKIGVVTRGAKLKGSSSGGSFSVGSPPPTSTATFTRLSRANNLGPTLAPQLRP